MGKPRGLSSLTRLVKEGRVKRAEGWGDDVVRYELGPNADAAEAPPARQPQYKPKDCRECGKSFQPRAPRQVICDQCRSGSAAKAEPAGEGPPPVEEAPEPAEEP